MAWDEVIGQEHVVQTLRNALKSERIGHAYLFTGSRGTGKTTTARLVAKAVNCLAGQPADRPDNTCAHCLAVNEGRFLDLIEIDAASNTSVDDVRDLRDKVNFAPNQGRYKVYIIDETHMLSNAAFNALLKTLEEPPPHVIFILATTEAHKVPTTITSRCQRFDFRRIPVGEIAARLGAIARAEGLNAEPAALEVVARQATGSMRDAESLLDQLIASPEETLTLERAQAALGTAAVRAVQDLAEALAAGDVGGGLSLINATVDAGADPRQFARQTVDYLRGLLMVSLGSASLLDVTPDLRAVMARQAGLFEAARLLRCIRIFNQAAADPRGGWQPQLPLELALVECVLGDQPAPARAEPASAATAPPPAKPSAAREAPVQRAAQPGPAPEPPAAEPARAAPRATAPASEPAAESASEVGLALSDIKRRWSQVKAAARKQHISVSSLINSCHPVKVEGNLVVLGTNAAIVVEKLGQAGTPAKVEAALSEALGQPCRFKVVLLSAAEARGGLDEEVAEDGVLAIALRDLGGKLTNTLGREENA
jgi:DNA polymerase-3 subunit gamma/tau